VTGTVLLDECVQDARPAFEAAGWRILAVDQASVDDDIAFYSRRYGCVVVTRDKHLKKMWKDTPFRLVFLPGPTLKRRKMNVKRRRQAFLAQAAARVLLRSDASMVRIGRELLFLIPNGQPPIPL
jgi:predicted nuclease of predicted toxin-antitoxin system